MPQITANMTINEVLTVDRKLSKILLNYGMHCLGCPHAMAETLEEAGSVHGVDIDAMVKELNDALAVTV